MNTHSTVLDNASVEAPSSDRILQIALAAWRQGNIVQVVDRFNDQFTFTDHALGLEFKDKGRLTDFLAKTRELFPDSEGRDNILSARSYWLKRFLIVPLLSTFALLTPTVSLAQQPTTMSAKSVAKLPFSPGLTLGDTLYVSGHLGVDPAVGKAPDDPEEEARQVLHSVELTLKEAGMTMDDLVYVEIYCTDLKLYGAFNKAYASTLKSPYPARDFIGVKDLLFGAHFEVMGIAVRNASQNKRQPLAVK
jgi:2-iminobutanoate/2-iminopropanoate deaminase